MSDLLPCPACRRHVRLDESVCPFCAAELPASAPRALPAGRLTRAAVFAGAALVACGGGKPKADQLPEAADASPPVVNAEVDAAVPAETPVEKPLPDHYNAKPYGAPPARERLV